MGYWVKNIKNRSPLNSPPGLWGEHAGSAFLSLLGGRRGRLRAALKALGVGPGLNVGKEVMAGLVPAIHAAPSQISRLLRLPSVQRLMTRLPRSRGWPGRARS
jgi:hypothetical protein